MTNLKAFLKLLKTIKPILRKGATSYSEIGISFTVQPVNKYIASNEREGLYKVITWIEFLIRLKFLNNVIEIGCSLGNPIKKKNKNLRMDEEITFD